MSNKSTTPTQETLTISSLQASNATTTGFQVSWATSQAANSAVNYGTTTSYGISTPANSSMVTAHQMSLTGLAPGTLYHFRVQSVDANGDSASSSDSTFATTGGLPAISGVTASNITTSGATIIWTTNTNTSSQVSYGTTAAYGQKSALNSTLASSHSITLSGLTASTMYHYQAVSVDGSGNQVTSADFTFTTTAAVTLPTISAVVSSNITASGATIAWTTNTNTSSQVNYGTTAAYGQRSALNSTLATGHSVALSGLTASTLYHFQAVSVDGSGKQVVSADLTFTTTAGVTLPTISAVASSSITTTGATITWTTNTNTSSQVNYGTTVAYGQKSALNSTLATGHSVTLSGLTASTLYHYQAVSIDGSGNQVVSADFTFTTTATTPLPTISAVGSSNVTTTGGTITWTTNTITTSQVNYGTTAAYGQKSALNSALVTSHSVTLSGLTASTLYHFQAVSVDGSGNQVLSADFTFTTAATAPLPTISAVASSNITTTGATITWTTNTNTSSQLNYGTTAAYGQKTALNSTLVTSHSVALTGLTSSTLYHYQALSVDGSGNQVASTDFTLTTAAAPLPVISGVTASNITSSGATIMWTTNTVTSSQVNYGTTAAYGQQSALNSSLVTSHSVALSGLTASTLFHYQAVSVDGTGNQTTSADFTFTTASASTGGGSFTANQWTKLNSSTALKGSVDHCPANNFNSWGYNFDQFCQGVFDAWTAFGYTTASVDGACMIEAGGGHSDYAGNELYEMCPATSNGSGQALGQMVRLTNPSQPASSCSNIDPLSGPTAPNQGHSYQFFVVAPNTNKLYRWATLAGTTGGTACATFSLWALDLSSVNMSCAPNCSASWTQLTPAGLPSTEVLLSAHAAYNPVDGKIYVYEPFDQTESGTVSAYDPVKNTWTKLGSLPTNSTLYLDVAIDASQNLMLIMGSSGDTTEPSGNLWVDLSGADGYAFHHPAVDSSCATLAAADGPGLDYDSARHRIVGWPNTGNTLYFPVINKSSGSITCSSVNAGSTAGTDFPEPTGFDGGAGETLGKLHYDSLNDIYVLHNNYNQPGWVWKP
ncbi:MAG: fibronectin type III domain-containing protein [Candidatus Acidiferrum sp.]